MFPHTLERDVMHDAFIMPFAQYVHITWFQRIRGFRSVFLQHQLQGQSRNEIQYWVYTVLGRVLGRVQV